MNAQRPHTAAPCPNGCGGTVEATAKVYFDITALSDCGEEVEDMEFAGTNDAYDGHPCALEAELSFYCSNDCELDFVVSGRAQERASLTGLSV